MSAIEQGQADCQNACAEGAQPQETCVAHRHFLVLLGGPLVLASALIVMGQPSTAADEDLPARLVAGLRSHMDRLQSGIVEFDVLDKDGGAMAKRFVAFDNSDGKVRCDMAEPVPDGRVVKVVHTKDEFLQYVGHKGGTSLVRMNSGEESVVVDGMPIDMRAVGFCRYGDLARGATAEAVSKSFDKMKVVDVVLEDDIAVVVFDPEVDGGVTQIVRWIDTANGYVPLRSEVRLVSPLGGSRVCQRNETSWARMKGAMVPVRSSFVFLGSGETIEFKEEMRFTWKSVNEEVPASLFTKESLELPDGTYVIDTRQGEPTVEEVIGVDRRLPDAPSSQRWTAIRNVLIGAGVLMLAVFVVLAARRRRRSSVSS